MGLVGRQVSGVELPKVSNIARHESSERPCRLGENKVVGHSAKFCLGDRHHIVTTPAELLRDLLGDVFVEE